MTVVFVVKEKAWLDGLETGNTVKFTAVNDGGKVTITALESLVR